MIQFLFGKTKVNSNGGCWSFKILEENSEEFWEDLSVYLVCNKLCETISDEIVGLSICLKKNNNVVIKIWNTNSKNNSLKLINEKILKQMGFGYYLYSSYARNLNSLFQF
jgi:hypothetical protein